MNNFIVINATALRSGGALTILKQCVESLPDDEFNYLVFVNSSVKVENFNSNLTIVHQDVLSFYKRLKWDSFGLKRWLKNNNISAIVGISLQNTNFRLSNSCPNYIYYHQSIPLVPLNWNFLKKNERSLWFYKNIYPFFVKLFINSKTEVFVQLNYIKERFSRIYKFPLNKIHVVFPKVNIPIIIDDFKIAIDENKFNLFYPATSVFFKNHDILFRSLSLIDDKLSSKLVVYLTINENDLLYPRHLNMVEFVFLGQVSFNEVIWMFNKINCLVFPSYIETLGLPLIEAASFGIPILSADLPYAREVLDGYNGVIYADYQNEKKWGDEILQLSTKKHTRFESFDKGNTPSWDYFFSIIKKNI